MLELKQIDDNTIEYNGKLFKHTGEDVVSPLVQNVTPKLPTLAEVFDKAKPKWFLSSDNDIFKADYNKASDTYNQLSTEAQVKQLQAYIALRNIADFYNEEIGWLPTESYYAIGIDLKVCHRDISYFHIMEIAFKHHDHAEQAIEILKEAGLLNALKW